MIAGLSCGFYWFFKIIEKLFSVYIKLGGVKTLIKLSKLSVLIMAQYSICSGLNKNLIIIFFS